MDYIICTRNAQGGLFRNEPGPAMYLEVPEVAEDFLPSHKISAADFLRKIINTQQEDIVIYVHGYNMTVKETLQRHRILRKGLEKKGFTGDVITFAWPSGDNTLLYLEDRHDAKVTAMELVNSGIKLLAKQQGKNCTVNVHVVAHSTGAFIINEAFDDAETTKSTAEINWSVSQLLFIGGDVSSDSMSTARGEKVYRHCNRLTNYFSPYDTALAVSNVKRVGTRNRVGRVGLPQDSPSKAVDVDCGHYYQAHKDNFTIVNGEPTHAWYFYSDEWLQDAYETIALRIDRSVISTREMVGEELRMKV